MRTLSPALHAELLRRYLRDTTPDPAGSRALAAQFQLLPLYLDWTGFFGLRVDGELLYVGWDAPHSTEIVTEPQWRRIAFTKAAERFRELASLCPQRTADSIECPGCDGHGRLFLDGKELPDNIVCYCGGLGWIPADEAGAFKEPGA